MHYLVSNNLTKRSFKAPLSFLMGGKINGKAGKKKVG